MNIGFEKNVGITFALIYLALCLASVFVFYLTKKQPEKNHQELALRTKSWWVMISLIAGSFLLGETTTIILFGLISFLALKEYFSMIPTRYEDRSVLFWCYLAGIVQYVWVAQSWYGMFIIFIQVYMFVLVPIRMLLRGKTEGFLTASSSIQWGLMVAVFGLSHAVLFVSVDHTTLGEMSGGFGLLLFLLLLTQFNDVAQYVWGKSFGKRAIVPSVSPNKTYEGFIGGAATTIILSVLIAPYLTPFSWYMALIAGVIIALAGFIGDVNMSALKRDIGVKDSSSFIPGHGGVLDRVDSLSFTAPLFFHFTYYFYY